MGVITVLHSQGVGQPIIIERRGKMPEGIGECRDCPKTYKTTGGAIRHLATGHTVLMPTSRYLQEKKEKGGIK